MRLKELDRSATVAWSPSGKTPGLLALGTVAGAIDDSFMATAQLEIVQLDLSKRDTTMPVMGAVSANYRFHRLAWGTKGLETGSYPYGLIAGGMVDGSVNLWNPAAIIEKNEKECLVAREEKHSGPVRGLEFNPYQPNLLASGATDSEIFIWDLSNAAEPSVYTPGQKSSPTAEISCVAWNRKVQHILASTSYSGTSVVWDLKLKRPVISFSDPNRRNRCSALAWNPDVATQIVVATDDDRQPLLQVWDLRNAYSPLKELSGHTKGILSISWCPNDSNLMLTCGKDNRTLCWNPHTGEIMTELPASANWSFDVQWSPRIPAILASCSFDGKVSIYSLQDSGPTEASDGAVSDFLGAAPKAQVSKPFSRAPKWLQRPVGACFGFGGRLATFLPGKTVTNADGSTHQSSLVQMHTVATEPELLARSDALEAATAEGGDIVAYCDARRAAVADAHEQETWAFLKILFEQEARREMLHHLGFNSDLGPDVHNLLYKGTPYVPPPPPAPAPPAPAAAPAAPPAAALAGDADSFFDNLAAQQAPPAEVPAAAADAAPAPPAPAEAAPAEAAPAEAAPAESPKGDEGGKKKGKGKKDKGEAASAAPAAAPAAAASGAKSEAVEEARKKLSQLALDELPYPSEEAEALIKKAIIVGNFEVAVDLCVRFNRMADALVLAACGGPALWAKTQQAFVARQHTAFAPVMGAVAGGQLQSLVERAEPAAWKETLAILCTYAPSDAFPALCDALARRLEGEAHDTRSATLCYICAGNLEKCVAVWGANVPVRPLGPYDALQDMIEKIVVFRKAAAGSVQVPALADKFSVYARLLASQGRVAVAMHYMVMANEDPRQDSPVMAILRDLLYHHHPTSGPAPAFPFQRVDVLHSAVPQPAAAPQHHAAPTPAPAAHAAPAAPQSAGYGYGAAAAGTDPFAAIAAQHAQQQHQQAAQQAAWQQPQAAAAPAYGQQQYGAYGQQGAQQYPQTQAAYGSYGQSAAARPAAAYGQQQPPATAALPAGGYYQQGAQAAAPATAAAGYYQQQGAQAAAGQAAAAAQPAAPITVFNPYASQGAGGRPAAPPTAPVPSTPPAPPAYGAGAAPPSTASPYGAPAPQPQKAGPSPYVPPSVQASSQATPAAPNVTITSADTTQVAPEMQPCVQSLLNLYTRCNSAATAPQAKKKMEDVAKRVGLLLYKLNQRDVSAAVCSKLLSLCQSLDAGDLKTAMEVQVQLTTTDWDEHGQWILGIKRLIESAK